jgi:hypothetical protein
MRVRGGPANQTPQPHTRHRVTVSADRAPPPTTGHTVTDHTRRKTPVTTRVSGAEPTNAGFHFAASRADADPKRYDSAQATPPHTAMITIPEDLDDGEAFAWLLEQVEAENADCDDLDDEPLGAEALTVAERNPSLWCK